MRTWIATNTTFIPFPDFLHRLHDSLDFISGAAPRFEAKASRTHDLLANTTRTSKYPLEVEGYKTKVTKLREHRFAESSLAESSLALPMLVESFSRSCLEGSCVGVEDSRRLYIFLEHILQQ